MKLTVLNLQARVEVVPSAASLIIKVLKETPRDRKKVKNGGYLERLVWCSPLQVSGVHLECIFFPEWRCFKEKGPKI